MTIQEARSFIGHEVALSWADRKGEAQHAVATIYSADFVPLYGPCLITDVGEIRLDRVLGCELSVQRKIA
jgi:hypothetical protein